MSPPADHRYEHRPGRADETTEPPGIIWLVFALALGAFWLTLASSQPRHDSPERPTLTEAP